MGLTTSPEHASCLGAAACKRLVFMVLVASTAQDKHHLGNRLAWLYEVVKLNRQQLNRQSKGGHPGSFTLINCSANELVV